MAGRGATQVEDAAVRVILPVDSPFESVGPHNRGQVVEVSPEEAHRLIETKGFALAVDEPAVE